MIKNVKLKKVLVNRIFPIFSVANKLIKKSDKYIFIYCANGALNDNSLALYEYLIRNEYYENYKIICGANKNTIQNKHKSTIIAGKLACLLWYMKSGHVFYSMGKIPIKPTNEQCVINMWHGAPLKTNGKVFSIDSGDEFFFTYVCAHSEFYRSIMAELFKCPEENVIICGDPKADNLFLKKKKRRNKLIVWAPTFRQSSYLGHNDSSLSETIPLFCDDEWNELNNYLKEQNVDLIVKLHPMQDKNMLKRKQLSNLKVYTDDEFTKRGGELHKTLSQSDALITDYSSVYLNYLMLDRPICFAIPDYEEYSNTRGLIFEKPLEYMPGKHAFTKADIYDFISDVSNENDQFRYERKRVNTLMNYYNDNKNCERVLTIAGINS